jgi:hypothetical protein
LDDAEVQILGETAIVELITVTGVFLDVITEDSRLVAELAVHKLAFFENSLSVGAVHVLTLLILLSDVVEDSALVKELNCFAFELKTLVMLLVRALNAERDALRDMVLQVGLHLAHIVVLVDVFEQRVDHAKIHIAF